MWRRKYKSMTCGCWDTNSSYNLFSEIFFIFVQCVVYSYRKWKPFFFHMIRRRKFIRNKSSFSRMGNFLCTFFCRKGEERRKVKIIARCWYENQTCFMLGYSFLDAFRIYRKWWDSWRWKISIVSSKNCLFVFLTWLLMEDDVWESKKSQNNKN